VSREPGQLLGKWARRGILLAAVVSVATVVASLLYGSRLVPMRPTQSDSYGFGPVGHHAFAETMKELGMNVVVSRGDRFEGPSAPMIFIEPTDEARIEGKDQTLESALAARRLAGHPSIVVLPKWNLFAGAVEPFITLREAEAETLVDVALPPAYLHDGPRTTRVKDTSQDPRHELYGVLGTYAAEVPSLQVITDVPPTATVLLESAHGAVVVVAPDGTLVVSEPDLIHNYNFARADHAALWWTLLADYGSDTLVIDETFHGHGKTHSLGRALGEFPTVLLVCHLLLLLLLLVFLGSRRFGPALPRFEHGHGPAEAIAVSAHVLADGQKLPDLVREYVTQVVLDLADRLGLPPRGSVADRARAIDEVAAHRGQVPEAQRLLHAASTLPAKTKSGDAWRIARAAHTYRERMLGRLRPETSSPTTDRPAGEERAA